MTTALDPPANPAAAAIALGGESSATGHAQWLLDTSVTVVAPKGVSRVPPRAQNCGAEPRSLRRAGCLEIEAVAPWMEPDVEAHEAIGGIQRGF